ncbi:Protein NipSnap 1 isoform 1 [Schistosoma japonicum]|uniref:Protein NipSnap n=1 Tax=Schistosoma japonicum TaxID=6182 RepID=C1LHM8_SCHJA|nr:Protein NipSnap 1 isoform 1 [Schistosoma japonicum]TNN08292.1 Protein NipSnap 1 isoform 1 [Schistosoma japonicum]CAX74206.1 Protein NipSnap [Schistosoma japonicum]
MRYNFSVLSCLYRCFSVKPGLNQSGPLTNIFKGDADQANKTRSDLLSTSTSVFELQVVSVKLDRLSEYLKDFGRYIDILKVNEKDTHLLGSWTCDIGDQGNIYHLWQFTEGYTDLSIHHNLIRNNKDLVLCQQKLDSLLHSRKNQVCLPLSYWPYPNPREDGFENIYELRSYSLQPGTMIEWGNHWARVMENVAEDNEAVAGLFSHIGDMHVVHHLWTYRDLEARRKARDKVWEDPNWGKCIMHIVPLLRSVTTAILRPTPCSLLR